MIRKPALWVHAVLISLHSWKGQRRWITHAPSCSISRSPPFLCPSSSLSLSSCRSRCRTPSTLTTIDAFTLKTKKKRNVWEEAMDEKDPPRFQCTVRPAARLTRRETAALHVGWDAHKPRVDQDPKPEKKPPSPQNYITSASDTPFVTQLPRKELPTTEDGRLLRSVAFDQLAAHHPSPPRSASAGSGRRRREEERRRKVAISETPIFITSLEED